MYVCMNAGIYTMFPLLTRMNGIVINLRIAGLGVLHNHLGNNICVSQCDTLRDDRHKGAENAQPTDDYAGGVKAHKEQTFKHLCTD